MFTRWHILIVLPVVLAAVFAVLHTARSGKAEHHGHSTDSRQLAQQWSELRRAGSRWAQVDSNPSWPFSGIVRSPLGMPKALRRETWQVLGKPRHLGLRFDLAARPPDRAAASLWVVPGNGVICLVKVPSVAAACTTSSRAYHHGIVLQTYKLGPKPARRPLKFVSLGIVPDGVRTVPIKIASHWRTITVVDNTFGIEARQPIGIPLSRIAPPTRLSTATR